MFNKEMEVEEENNEFHDEQSRTRDVYYARF